MRLTLHFDVNQQRITLDDVKWMRRFQRELVSTAASIVFLDVASRQDPALADYLAAGDGVTHSDGLQPSERLMSWYRPDERPSSLPLTLAPTEIARDICIVAHWDEWMAARWAVKVHTMLLQAHTRTESVRNGGVTIVTRAALPPGVNERCHAILGQIIDACWFTAREPDFDLFDPQNSTTLRVRNALTLRFTSGLIKERLEQTLAFEVSRLDPGTGNQDPDCCHEHSRLDGEMFVRLFRADCSLDHELPRSDADIGIERW